MGKKLYVGNLSYDVSSSDLETMLAAHGTVLSAQVITDRDTGRSKGFGFVEMDSADEADAAIAALTRNPAQIFGVVDAGTLRLGWWKGNEKLKHERIDVKLPESDAGKGPIVMLGGKVDTKKGAVLEGTLALPKRKGARRKSYQTSKAS